MIGTPITTATAFRTQLERARQMDALNALNALNARDSFTGSAGFAQLEEVEIYPPLLEGEDIRARIETHMDQVRALRTVLQERERTQMSGMLERTTMSYAEFNSLYTEIVPNRRIPKNIKWL